MPESRAAPSLPAGPEAARSCRRCHDPRSLPAHKRAPRSHGTFPLPACGPCSPPSPACHSPPRRFEPGSDAVLGPVAQTRASGSRASLQATKCLHTEVKADSQTRRNPRPRRPPRGHVPHQLIPPTPSSRSGLRDRCAGDGFSLLANHERVSRAQLPPGRQLIQRDAPRRGPWRVQRRPAPPAAAGRCRTLRILPQRRPPSLSGI